MLIKTERKQKLWRERGERGKRNSCHFREAILRICNKGRILILDGISANHSDEYFHSLSRCDSPSGTDETYLLSLVRGQCFYTMQLFSHSLVRQGHYLGIKWVLQYDELIIPPAYLIHESFVWILQCPHNLCIVTKHLNNLYHCATVSFRKIKCCDSFKYSLSSKT